MWSEQTHLFERKFWREPWLIDRLERLEKYIDGNSVERMVKNGEEYIGEGEVKGIVMERLDSEMSSEEAMKEAAE